MKNKGLPYIIASAVLVIILGGVFIFVHMPMAQSITAKQTELTQKQAQLALVKQKVKELVKLKNDITILQNEKLLIETQIPNEADVPGVVTMLEKFSDESGVILSNVGFDGAAQASTTVPTINFRTCNLDLVGSYESIIRYFDCVNKSSRLFGIKSISLAPTDDSGKMLKMHVVMDYFNYIANNTTAANQTTSTNQPQGQQ